MGARATARRSLQVRAARAARIRRRGTDERVYECRLADGSAGDLPLIVAGPALPAR